jgi:hypothetical protein
MGILLGIKHQFGYFPTGTPPFEGTSIKNMAGNPLLSACKIQDILQRFYLKAIQ